MEEGSNNKQESIQRSFPNVNTRRWVLWYFWTVQPRPPNPRKAGLGPRLYVVGARALGYGGPQGFT